MNATLIKGAINLTATAILLAGCTANPFLPDDPRFADRTFARDFDLCDEIVQYELEQQYPSAVGGGGGLLGFMLGNAIHNAAMSDARTQMMNDCMRRRGHGPVELPQQAVDEAQKHQAQ